MQREREIQTESKSERNKKKPKGKKEANDQTNEISEKKKNIQ